MKFYHYTATALDEVVNFTIEHHEDSPFTPTEQAQVWVNNYLNPHKEWALERKDDAFCAIDRLIEDAPLSQDEIAKIIYAHLVEWSQEESEINETDDKDNRFFEGNDQIHDEVRDLYLENNGTKS